MRIVHYEDDLGTLGYACQKPSGACYRLLGQFPKFEATNDPVTITKIRAPVMPPAIYCIGLNYGRHIVEFGGERPDHPVVFMKAPTAVQHPRESIRLPRFLASHKVDYEGELAVIIGTPCRNVSADQALDFVFGYTLANDVSARDWQKEWGGGQFCRGKTFDTFCPLGPQVITADEFGDPQAHTLRSFVNGELRQEDATREMIFSVAKLIEFLAGSTTLLPGTVILTGTPEGVGMGRNPPEYLHAGDSVRITLDDDVVLENSVEEETLSHHG